MSSELCTMCSVGVFGCSCFILFLSALVTKEGVIGTTGVNGWYGEYGTAAPVNGVRMPPGDSGALSNTVCFVVCVDGEAKDGS